MPECATDGKADLLSSRWAVLLWWLPWALIIIGMFTGTLGHTVLWTAGFAAAGGACVANARHCGRRHCFYTGPLFLLASLASLLYGLGVLPLGVNGWGWIIGVALVGCLLSCCVLEAWLGKYSAAR
ncbi:MAG: hypothetical protein KGL98_04420 [Gammaproteobacteria bacterium]|nr:hypothetical protein [Gammaproteobacteria bacterium]MBU6510425.1 hypothetical protein [Gammaproteobacteria bacterium]MDE1984025.1 hypothetical protein [Gammaproteobacteria bacterium]MDE2108551.1 hypothetical protein [Gammaproteobacteria bacterium]MDE2460471.1 hypothetical protein [Gammaproteobacteria bacterium]